MAVFLLVPLETNSKRVPSRHAFHHILFHGAPIVLLSLRKSYHLAMGQNPVPPVNIPISTKIGSKMGGAPAPTPKWDPMGFDPWPFRAHRVPPRCHPAGPAH